MIPVYASGFDTVVAGYGLMGSLGVADTLLLDTCKGKAQEKQFDATGVPVVFHGRHFRVLPKGVRGYEWVLQNDDVEVALARQFKGGVKYGEAMVTYRSAYLWRQGFDACESSVRSWLGGIADVVNDRVSRADLNGDFGDSLPDLALNSGEIGGVVLKKDYHISGHGRGNKVTGYELGAGDLCGRIYDKVAESKLKGKEWFFDIWKKNGWDGETPVTRVEFQFRRNWLVQHQVKTVADLKAIAPDLWKYCTERWLKIRCKNRLDSNSRRWRLSELWQSAQATVARFGEITGVIRLKQLKPKYESTWRNVRGGLVTAVALVTPLFGVDLAIAEVRKRMEIILSEGAFVTAVNDRQVKFATM